MPASTSCATLDQAKDWAKRLLKATPAIGKLSDAQAAVAIMLGHTSWHALQAYYKNQETSPTTTAGDTSSSAAQPHGFGEVIDGPQATGTIWDSPQAPDFSTARRKVAKPDPLGLDRQCEAANIKYPGLNAVRVEMMGSEIEIISGNADDVMQHADNMEGGGWGAGSDSTASLVKAMEDRTYRIHAPPEHFLMRVSDDKGVRSMVILPYQKG